MHLKDLSFISNQISGALLSSDGDIVWSPMPKFDRSPLFCRLLDENAGGHFSIKPLDEAKISQVYIAPNILETTFQTLKGRAMITDFMPFGQTSIIRKVDTNIVLDLEIIPTFDYGRIKPSMEIKGDGMKFYVPNSTEGLEVRFFGLAVSSKGGHFSVNPSKGYIYILYSQDISKGLFSEKGDLISYPKEAFERTMKYWEHLLPKEYGIKSPGTDDNGLEKLYSNSLSVILGLFYAPSGAPISAPTTSLPETIGGSRNWDYRFIWVRDSCIMAAALTSAGLLSHGKKIIQFLMRIMDFSGKPFNQPLYELDGSAPFPEKTIDWLSGFKNSKPVRVGNSAYRQIQLDIEGFFIGALFDYYQKSKDKDFISESLWAIEYCADWVARNWKLGDAGIWEESTNQQFTFSKAMMWAVLDKAGKLASVAGKEDRWSENAAAVKSWIMKNCIKDGHFVKFPGSDQVDGALLNLPLIGFIKISDPIFDKTLKEIEKKLVLDGYVFRYRSDTLGEAKHPFTLCSTWLSRVYAGSGRTKEATDLLLNISKISQQNGLIGEHIDVENGDFLGNYPQGFAHAGLVIAINEIKNYTGLNQSVGKDAK